MDPNGLTYTATPGILENLRVLPENYKTRESVPYEFSFETKNQLMVGSDLAIIVPAEIDVDPVALRVTALASLRLAGTIQPTWDASTRTIQLDSAFD